MLGQAIDDCRHGKAVRDALARDHLDQRTRIQRCRKHMDAADHRGEKDTDGGDVKHRRRMQIHAMRIDVESDREIARHRVQAFMRQHHAFRQTRGATCKEYAGEIIAITHRLRERRTARAHVAQGHALRERRANANACRWHAHVVHQLLGKTAKFITEEQHLDAGIFELKTNFRLRQTRIERHNDGAGPKHCVIQLKIRNTIVRQHGDTIALSDVQPRKTAGKTCDIVVKLPPSAAVVAIDRRWSIAKEPRCSRQRLSQTDTHSSLRDFKVSTFSSMSFRRAHGFPSGFDTRQRTIDQRRFTACIEIGRDVGKRR